MSGDLFNTGARSLPANPLPQEPKTDDDGREFTWSDVEKNIELQCPTSVYANNAGGVTIRQDQTGMVGDDVIVVLATPDAVRKVIAALQRELAGM